LATLAASAVGYAFYLRHLLSKQKPINLNVQKESSKVVHSFNAEDLDKKTVFCRCWRSKKFPYCDGSHNEHNNKTGDNIGPVIVQKQAE
jgi:CDGSH iron-sulfur domain-containing protein 1